MVCIHGLVSCLGILENALVLWVLGVRVRRKTVAAVWVLNLALSDFLATLTLPLFTHYLHEGSSWELGSAMCSAQASIFFLNMFVSAYLLAAISLDRCLLVTRPVWSQNHRSVAAAWKVCAMGWLWAAVNAFPYFLFRSVTPKLDGRKLCYHNFALYSSPAALHRDCGVRQAATAISKALLAFVVPLVIIAGSYIYFGLSLQARNRRRLQTSCKGLGDSGGSAALSALKQGSGVMATSERLSRGFTKMVASVIAAFILCWAPYHAFCLLEVAAQYKPESFAELVEQGLPLATTCAFLNPVLNPLLYAFSCPHFCTRIRQSLSALLEGLVEEGSPVAGGLVRRRTNRAAGGSSSFTGPNSPTSPNTPGISRHNLTPQGSVNGCSFKKCPTEDTHTESLKKCPLQEGADSIV